MADLASLGFTGPLSRSSRWFYQATRVVFVAFFRTWCRMTVTGSENVPPTGGFILAAGGHRSILDTPIVAGTSKRILRYMGAEKYFDVPGLSWFLRSLGGFPVQREATDRDALRLSEEVLASGEPLVIYPEGTRFSGSVIQPLQQGAAFLACRSQVPIIPVGMGGTERAWPKGGRIIRPTKVALVVGEPLVPPVPSNGKRVKRSAVRAYSDQLHTRLQELFDEAQGLAGA
jgi:1-acyl-sn-glycerol-3-phosphate acyltransferase